MVLSARDGISVGRTIQDQLCAEPDRIALRLVAGDGQCRAVSASALSGRATEYAFEIAARVNRGDLVAICLYHGLDLYAAFIGALWAGATPMMLPPPSPRIEPEKYSRSLRHMCRYVSPLLIIADDSTAPAPALYSKGNEDLPRMLRPADVAGAGERFSIGPSDPGEIAMLQHSSGTTGLQKGVALSHAAVIAHNAAYRRALALARNDVIVSWLPLYHDMGFISCFIMPLMEGIEIVAMSPFDWVRRPMMLLEQIHQMKGTLCWMPNFAFALLARLDRLRPAPGELDLSGMRAWINSSEPVHAPAHDAFVERFSRFGVHKGQLTASYAMAENVYAVTQSQPGQYRTLSVASVNFREAHEASPVPADSAHATTFVSNGMPVEGTELTIIDTLGATCGMGCVGEIAIRGKYLFSGYFRRPDLTREVMYAAGWFRTGDLGFLYDGELYVTGRLKDLIIVQGRNFYPADLETTACVPGVIPGRVVAFGMNDDVAGTEGIIILLERDETSDVTDDEIVADVRKRIAQEFDCTPSVVRIVPPRWLVKSSSGKLARSENRAKYLHDRDGQARPDPLV